MVDKKITPELDLQLAAELTKSYPSQGWEYRQNVNKKPVSALTEWILFIRDICIILGVVIFLRTYIVAPFTINGSSMESSYHSGEFILVDKISYSLAPWIKTEPARGDVVVIEPHARSDRQYYIKRIIGMPGETLQIKGGIVSIKKIWASDFIELQEDYLSPANRGKTFANKLTEDATYTIPDGSYFIMGDNRNNSTDSRECFQNCSMPGASHFLKSANISGKLLITFGSLRIFENKSIIPFDLSLAENMGFEIAPRFLDSPKTWTYPELTK